MTRDLARSLVDAAAEALRGHCIDETKYDSAQEHDACICGPRIEDWDVHWAEVAGLAIVEKLAEEWNAERRDIRLPADARTLAAITVSVNKLRKLADAIREGR